jgi:hypothetical protein
VIASVRQGAASARQTIANTVKNAINPRNVAIAAGGVGALGLAGYLLKQHTAKSDRHSPEQTKRGDQAPRPDGSFDEEQYGGTPHEPIDIGHRNTVRMEGHGTGMNINIRARGGPQSISNKSDVAALMSSALHDQGHSNVNINHTDDRRLMGRDYVSDLFSKAISGNY